MACGAGDDRSETSRRSAGEEAQPLAQEVFQLVDQAVEYAGSGRSRSPQRLHDVGIDSLTPETARWLRSVADEPVVTVAYRRPGGRSVVSCSGGPQILEDEALEGVFRVSCTLSDGSEEIFTVTRDSK